MIFSDNDIQRINNFYLPLIDKYWINPEWLSRINKQSQEIRFKIFCEMIDLENKSILDVGCWFWDLYWYISKLYQIKQYLWVDIVEDIINKAKQKYPNASFDNIDFLNYSWKKFDIIFAAGSLSFKIDNYQKIYKYMIKKMYEYSNIWVWFNMLNIKYHVNDDNFASYHPSEIYEYCSSFCEKLILRQDYLIHDFTIYLYH